MRVIVNRRGMALFVVFAVLLCLFTLATHMIRSNIDTAAVSKIAREGERADFLARGAIQIALLKLSVFPYEFVDAITWKRGTQVYSEDWRKGIPGIPATFKGNTSLGNEKYYQKFVGYIYNEASNTGTLFDAAKGSDLQFNIEQKTDEPWSFAGSAIVQFIHLLSQQDPERKHWINAVEIRALGDETSEMGGGDWTRGTMHSKTITELYRFNRVHVEGN